MVKPIVIQCPYCGQRSEIVLSTDASMILLNCPGCLKPLIYHKRRCIVLNRRQVKQIESSRGEKDLHRMLRRIVEGRQQALPAPVSQPWGTAPQWAREISREGISEDDITNLRIDLETCFDTGAFIQKM